MPVRPDPSLSLYWIDQRGGASPADWLAERPFASWRVSPDGESVAFTTLGRHEDIWVCDLTRGTMRKLTSGVRVPYLCWSPDGKWIAFSHTGGGTAKLCRVRTEGSGRIEQVAQTNCACFYVAEYTPDGSSILVNQCGPNGNWDVWEYEVRTGIGRPILSGQASETGPTISRDGRWMAYASDETGRNEVYVTSFPSRERTVMISNQGGELPVWAPEGNELYYRGVTPNTARMMAVAIRGGVRMTASRPRLLFERKTTRFSPVRNFDIAPDGRRFLLSENLVNPPVEVTRLTLVLNWFEEIKRVAPPH